MRLNWPGFVRSVVFEGFQAIALAYGSQIYGVMNQKGFKMTELHRAPTAHFFGATDIGKSGRSNQDHYLIADMRRLLKVCDSSVECLAQQSVVSRHSGELLMIADGMGAHANGGYASQTAISFMTDYVANLLPKFLNIDPNDDREFCTALNDAPILVHRLFRKEGENDPTKAEMGTTLKTACIVWPNLYVVHVGDTRCYLFRDGELRQLTKDHTVSMAEIVTVLESSESVEFKTKQLINESNRCGGRDNISVVIGAFNGPPDADLLCDDPGQFKVIETTSSSRLMAAIGYLRTTL